MEAKATTAPRPLRLPGLWRMRLVATGLLLFWMVLAGRLVQLHSFSGKQLANLAERQRSLEEAVPARPGDILDRNGRVYATSVAVPSVYVVPNRMSESWAVAEQLAAALDLDPDRLYEQISLHSRHQFLWVKRRISTVEAERVRKLKLPETVWGFREEFRRYYPMGTLAAHVVGMRDIDGKGKGGVEEQYDALLRGADGSRQLMRDARGRVIEVREQAAKPPKHGTSLQLTIDSRIQSQVELALDELALKFKPHSACAVVLDPKTSEVLALSSRPTFDPNQPAGVPDAAWKNTALCAIYEPGSTFKPFIVAFALQQGVVKSDESFDCENGEYRMGRRLLHDHHPYGNLSVTDILVKSSNIGMAKIGLRLQNTGLYDAASVFGFGAVTGIDLPGELPGLLRPLAKWTSYSTGSIPMGQELSTTPLQIITAYGALSNGGQLISPHVVLRRDDHLLQDLDSSSAPRQELAGPVVSKVIQREPADWVRTEALTAVIERGTGKRARLAGYKVFGKTGTAQKLDPRGGGYSSRLHISSFVCGAPAADPRVLVIVSVDEPHGETTAATFGGTVAAPTAASILEKSLRLLEVPSDPTVTAGLDTDLEVE